MNVLITAGGTSERIDQVRHLMNRSTGRLGKALAEYFSTFSECQITYVHGKNAVLPALENHTFYPIESVGDLEKTLKKLLSDNHYDIIIHAMAVSDYQFATTSHIEQLSQQITQAIRQTEIDLSQQPDQLECLITDVLTKDLMEETPASTKLSSNFDDLLIGLKRAPKVIALLRQSQPNAFIVGFKLLVDVSNEELDRVATALLHKNKLNLVVANDLTRLTDDTHPARLVHSDESVLAVSTRQDIAKGIYHAYLKQKEEM